MSNGIYIRFEKDIETEVRRALLEFTKWLRLNVKFPSRVMVYVKKIRKIKTLDGQYATATFFEPYEKGVQSYIKLATGDYHELVEKWGKDEALASILYSFGHEIGHYEQWVKGKPSSCSGASNRASGLLTKYAQTRDCP